MGRGGRCVKPLRSYIPAPAFYTHSTMLFRRKKQNHPFPRCRRWKSFLRAPPSSLSKPIKVREIYVAHSDINTRAQSMQIECCRKLSALWRLSLQLNGNQHFVDVELCLSLKNPTNGLAEYQRTSRWITWKCGQLLWRELKVFIFTPNWKNAIRDVDVLVQWEKKKF